MGKSKVLCSCCDAKITKADAFCPKCKHPTVFATVEQRTAWELEQWASKRTAPRKKVSAAMKPKRAPAVEQPAPAREVAAVSEPIKRVRMQRTIHPAVAARAARQVAAVSAPEPVSKDPVMPVEEKRVIVLPEAVMTDPAPVMKKIARAPRKAATPKAQATGPKKPEPEAPKIEALKKPEPEASNSEAAPKKIAAAPAKAVASAPKPRRKAPKMAPMPIEVPVQAKNGNGNGHATNGNGAAHAATAEQIEILRELLRRVSAIEEKMTVPQPRARRFGLRKR